MPAGVYVIFCRVNRKFYVGQSSNIHKRWGFHRFQLRQGSHDTKSLQFDWDSYGEHKFQFKVLEVEPDKSQRLRLESEWIHRLEAHVPEKGYNKATFGNLGGLTHAQATRLRMSEAAKVRNADPGYKQILSERCKKQHQDGTLNITPESRRKAGAANRGKAMSEEHKEKLRQSALQRRDQMQAAARKSVIARGFTPKAMEGSGRPRNVFKPTAAPGQMDFETLKG